MYSGQMFEELTAAVMRAEEHARALALKKAADNADPSRNRFYEMRRQERLGAA